jgi:hypothetical protein
VLLTLGCNSVSLQLGGLLLPGWLFLEQGLRLVLILSLFHPLTLHFNNIHQFGATYLLSIPALYNLDFPGGISNDNVKWRAVVWIVSEALLFIGVAISCLPRTFHFLAWLCTGRIRLLIYLAILLFCPTLQRTGTLSCFEQPWE